MSYEAHGHFIEDENGNQTKQVAWSTPAKEEDALALLQAPRHADGRSDFVWMRLHDGTLFLAVFPKGDTYMEYSDAGVCDWEDAEPKALV